MVITSLREIDFKILLVIGLFSLFILVIALKFLLTHIANNYIVKNKLRLFNENKVLVQRVQDLDCKLAGGLSSYIEYVEFLGIDKKIICSSSVVANASANRVKYILKYSNIENSKTCLEQIDFCISYLKLVNDLHSAIEDLLSSIYSSLPPIVKKFATTSQIPYTICDISHEIAHIENPIFSFSYVSPAGKSRRSYNIEITPYILKDIRSEISARIEKSGHSKIQRSIMTNDLREAIKKRDNYTCRICGNSVFNEPNLLLEVDHIIPISKGGKTEASNLQTLCWRCNRQKSNK